jgi:pimeloyl-ACP methyl ester carboxylesterase
VAWTDFTTHDDGVLIAGRRDGAGPPVLLLHGGPSLGFGYLRDLADELVEENDVAWYQQRGLEPSAVEGPYSVAADVDDARRVLDTLGWERAYVVGHSWGGHLALHVAEAMPELRMAIERGGEMMPSITAELPALEARLPAIRVPVGFVHGSRSPMPIKASTDSAERIPGAWVDVVEGAGHFIWFEAPGAVRAALRRHTRP